MFINYSAKGFKRFTIFVFIFLMIFWPVSYWLTGVPYDGQFWFLYLFFGVGMGIANLFVFHRYIKTGPHIVQSKTIPLPENKDIKTILAQVKAQKKWKVREIDKSQYELETPMTWASFGEKINVIMLDEGLKIVSTPKIPFTYIDYGKNSKNLNEIIRIVEDY